VSADGILFLALFLAQLEIEAVFDFGEGDAAPDLEDAGSPLEEVVLLVVELVAERSHDLLERVFAEREADGGSVLVDDHGAMLSARLELTQEVRERHRIGNEEGLPRNAAKIGCLAAERGVEHVLGMHDSDDRVESQFTQREARVTARSDPFEVLLERVLEREEIELDPREYDVTHFEFDHAEDVLGEFVLVLRDVARACRQRQDAPDLLGVVAGFVAHFDGQADEPQQPVRKTIDHVDEGAEDPREDSQRRSRGQRHSLGATERPHLRSLLAHRHVERRDHGEGDSDRDDRHPARVGRNVESHGFGRGDQQDGYGGLAQRAEDQARERDAELAGRQIAIQVAEDVSNGRRCATAVPLQLGDSGLAHLDQRELGRDEEAVQRDEEEGCAESPGNAEEVEGNVGVAHGSAAHPRATDGKSGSPAGRDPLALSGIRFFLSRIDVRRCDDALPNQIRAEIGRNAKPPVRGDSGRWSARSVVVRACDGPLRSLAAWHTPSPPSRRTNIATSRGCRGDVKTPRVVSPRRCGRTRRATE